MSIKGQCHSLTLVKGHSDFKVKFLTFGLFTQVSDSGPLGPLVICTIHLLMVSVSYVETFRPPDIGLIKERHHYRSDRQAAVIGVTVTLEMFTLRCRELLRLLSIAS